jgi:iron-sulfur cluster assembly accessory protein
MSLITVTDSAKHQINTICEENNVYAVTLNMKGGGCAGFEYDWGTIDSPDTIESNDIVIEAGKGKLVVGSHSLMFLLGTEIHYKKDIMGAMFDIRNPNAQSSCGCGVSVNFDMDKLPDLANPV